jgi:hypothetical protein
VLGALDWNHDRHRRVLVADVILNHKARPALLDFVAESWIKTDLQYYASRAPSGH